MSMEIINLTPEVLDMLAEIRTAVKEGRVKEAESLMIQVRDIVFGKPLPPRRPAGWC